MECPIPDRRASGEYDPARLLTIGALGFVAVLVVFVCFIIGWQIWKNDEANTESWAALTGLIGWATAKVGDIFSNRYGTTQQSTNKDAVIAQQVRTAAVAQGAVAPVPASPTPPDQPPKGETP